MFHLYYRSLGLFPFLVTASFHNVSPITLTFIHLAVIQPHCDRFSLANPPATLRVSLPLAHTVLVCSSPNLFIYFYFCIFCFIFILCIYVYIFLPCCYFIHTCFSITLSSLHSQRCLYPPLPFPCSTLLAVTTLTNYHPVRTFPYRIYVTVPAFFSPRTLDPWRWNRYFVPKRR